MELTDKNLFAYCDNNPVVRIDHGGLFWKIALDILSLGTSISEVSCNPTDVGAWIGLVGDIIDVWLDKHGYKVQIKVVGTKHEYMHGSII